MMQPRDPRYELIKPMLKEGKITTFQDIFKYIKKSVVAADLGKKVNRFSRLMEHVEDFVVKDLLLIGRFCNLTAARRCSSSWRWRSRRKRTRPKKKDTLSTDYQPTKRPNKRPDLV